MNWKLFGGFFLHLRDCLAGHSQTHDWWRKNVIKWRSVLFFPLVATLGSQWSDFLKSNLRATWEIFGGIFIFGMFWQSYSILVASKKRESDQKEELQKVNTGPDSASPATVSELDSLGRCSERHDETFIGKTRNKASTGRTLRPDLPQRRA